MYYGADFSEFVPGRQEDVDQGPRWVGIAARGEKQALGQS